MSDSAPQIRRPHSALVSGSQVSVAATPRRLGWSDSAGAASHVDTGAHVPDVERLATARLAILTHEIEEQRAAREKAIADARLREVAAYEKGVDEGRTEGKRLAERNFAALDQSLTNAIATSMRLLEGALAELKREAATIALAAMEKVLGNERNFARNLTLMIKRQVEEMRGALLVAVRVSPIDFPDIAALRTALGNFDSTCELIVDPSLESGDCRIQLSLGEANIGVSQQLSALRHLVARGYAN